MASVFTFQTEPTPRSKTIANELADRLERGARALAEFARNLTDADWQTQVPRDGRTIGVIVHHVASVYPLEIQLAQLLAGGKAIEGVTWADVHVMNARHAAEQSSVTEGRSAGVAGAEQHRCGGCHSDAHR